MAGRSARPSPKNPRERADDEPVDRLTDPDGGLTGVLTGVLTGGGGGAATAATSGASPQRSQKPSWIVPEQPGLAHWLTG
ncbi:hypothetical protein ACIBG7_08130 [Nonomuraea sp. NPDC050328]|uniref:hypothetical protein n=1 Tax=Nonomuraea sp. NPDC050328 TaxID=3364361 RepID=UPI0037A6863B